MKVVKSSPNVWKITGETDRKLSDIKVDIKGVIVRRDGIKLKQVNVKRVPVAVKITQG